MSSDEDEAWMREKRKWKGRKDPWSSGREEGRRGSYLYSKRQTHPLFSSKQMHMHLAAPRGEKMVPA